MSGTKEWGYGKRARSCGICRWAPRANDPMVHVHAVEPVTITVRGELFPVDAGMYHACSGCASQVD